MDKLVVYGIKNCDTVKKALTWLDSHKIDYDFHDYKTKGITDAKLKAWAKQVGWESLVNKKGMTWRQLDDAVKANVTSASTAIELMKQKTSVIKRPLLELNDTVVALGFDSKEFGKIKRS